MLSFISLFGKDRMQVVRMFFVEDRKRSATSMKVRSTLKVMTFASRTFDFVPLRRYPRTHSAVLTMAVYTLLQQSSSGA